MALADALLLLPQATAVVAQGVLGALGTPLAQDGIWLRHGNGFLAEVSWDCTALWPAVVLVLAIALFGRARGRALRSLLPALLGAVAYIAVINQLRVVAVLWVGVHAPAAFTWMHEAVSPLLLVGAGAAYLVAVLGQGGPTTPAPRPAAA